MAQSNLLETIAAPQHSVSYQYETGRDAIAAVVNKDGSQAIISQYGYRYDNLGRRTDRTHQGYAFTASSLSKFEYDSLGQVTRDNRFAGTDPDLPGTANHDQSFGFAFDMIGNRDTAETGPDKAGGAVSSTSYASNAVNQYTSIGGASPSYDVDGNLEEDGSKEYSWNGENRLIKVAPDTPSHGDEQVEFTYDYQGRRVSKVVSTWDSGSGQYSVQNSHFYVYDGWNLILERTFQNSQNTLQHSYTWGLDLSGSMQGAEGVGGLLSQEVEDLVNATSKSLYSLYDGNGNLTQLADGSGTIVGHVEYGPFGEVVSRTGSGVADNNFWFSSKYEDEETGLLYYGFRYYDSSVGRWTNRDPIGEAGGTNVYSFASNNAVNNLDYLGWDVQYGPFKSKAEREANAAEARAQGLFPPGAPDNHTFGSEQREQAQDFYALSLWYDNVVKYGNISQRLPKAFLRRYVLGEGGFYNLTASEFVNEVKPLVNLLYPNQFGGDLPNRFRSDLRKANKNGSFSGKYRTGAGDGGHTIGGVGRFLVNVEADVCVSGYDWVATGTLKMVPDEWDFDWSFSELWKETYNKKIKGDFPEFAGREFRAAMGSAIGGKSFYITAPEVNFRLTSKMNNARVSIK